MVTIDWGRAMNSIRPLTDDAEKTLLRRCWYAHDARWFNSVAEEFGIEAANRLNRRTVRSLGRAEMLRLMRALDAGRATALALTWKSTGVSMIEVQKCWD